MVYTHTVAHPSINRARHSSNYVDRDLHATTKPGHRLRVLLAGVNWTHPAQHHWQHYRPNSGTVGHFNFWLSLSLSDSLSKTLSWTPKSGFRLKFNLTLDLDFRWAKVKMLSESQKVKWLKISYLFYANSTGLSQLVQLNIGLSMYLDRNLGIRLSLSEITLLFDLSLYFDRTLAQRKA